MSDGNWKAVAAILVLGLLVQGIFLVRNNQGDMMKIQGNRYVICGMVPQKTTEGKTVYVPFYCMENKP